MKKEIIKRSIYPDFEKDISEEEMNERLKKFGIYIKFLLDTVEIEYPDNFSVKYFPGDISFYNDKELLTLSIIETFTSFDIYIGNFDDTSEPYMSIPVCDTFLYTLKYGQIT